MDRHQKDSLDHWLTTDPRDEGAIEEVMSDEDDHAIAQYLKAAGEEPKPWPANKLRVRAINDHGQIRIEVDNPPTEEAHQILMTVLPVALERFMRKNQDYQGFGMAGLGPRAHFVGIWRKVGKLKRVLWDGETLATEQLSEVLDDLLGHILLAALESSGRIGPE